MTCFLRIEMHYLEPCKNRLSAGIVVFNSSLAAYMTYPWILGVDIHMDLGIVDMYDSVRSPLRSHEDMHGMSVDKSWSMREAAFPFRVLDRAIGISETVLKDKMI